MLSDFARQLAHLAIRQTAKLLVAVLLGGLIGGALARYSAGFGVDERELDPRLSQASVEAVRANRAEGSHFAGFYLSFLRGIARGDLGFSTTLNRPVKQLIGERMSVTLREIAGGLAVAAASAVLLAALVGVRGARPIFRVIEALSGVSLCLPAAVLGYFCILFRIPPFWAMAVCAFPYVFRYTANLIESSQNNPHVLSARARGVRGLRLQSVHFFLPNLPEILATLTVVVSICFGAAVPIEFATETPGLGQLAWQAASSRDLPLLCVLTMIATALVLGAGGLAEVVQLSCFRRNFGGTLDA